MYNQVILDVVYNHTNEADDKNPYTTSFRGIDNKVCYFFVIATFHEIDVYLSNYWPIIHV